MPAAVHHHATLDSLQRITFDYFLHETNPVNGLVADKTQEGTPASIAAVGLALAAYPVGVEHGLITRDEAIGRTLAALRFFWTSPHGPQPDATGHRGFYYHFLDMATGRRAWRCELSTVDTAFLIAGMLLAAEYFERDTPEEHEIRELTDTLYRRVDWRWAEQNRGTVCHGWKPETGFLEFRWQGYDEALLLYVLGLGSPTFALSEHSFAAWRSTYEWRRIYDYEYLHSGPLFTHQLSHVWIDFRGIQDEFMRSRECDYFENSRRATHVQREYAIRNPHQFARYGPNCWGVTASDGPGWLTMRIDGVERRFFDYLARGAPDGPDDGTIAPWAVVASLPFAPQIVIPAIENFDDMNLRVSNPYGFKATFNATYPGEPRTPIGWVTPWHYGLNQGPIVLMIENFRSGMPWHLMRRCRYLVTGLRRAGFKGGWLD